PVKSTTCTTRFCRSGTGTTPGSTSATPTPEPLYFLFACGRLIVSFQTALAPYVSYLFMSVLAMWSRPSPHSRHTAGDAERAETVEPGTGGGRAPAIRRAVVWGRHGARTRFMDAGELGTV